MGTIVKRRKRLLGELWESRRLSGRNVVQKVPIGRHFSRRGPESNRCKRLAVLQKPLLSAYLCGFQVLSGALRLSARCKTDPLRRLRIDPPQAVAKASGVAVSLTRSLSPRPGEGSCLTWSAGPSCAGSISFVGSPRDACTQAAGTRPMLCCHLGPVARRLVLLAKRPTRRPRASLSDCRDTSRRTSSPAGVSPTISTSSCKLDAWFQKANARAHKMLRARPIDREPAVDRRWVMRVPPAPYLRVDTNDYSLGPKLVGRVEVRASLRKITAVALDSGEAACRHERSFAKHRTITALGTQGR